jgi:hypothetical protein
MAKKRRISPEKKACVALAAARAEAESEALVSPDIAVEDADPREEEVLSEEDEAALTDSATLRRIVSELKDKQ